MNKHVLKINFFTILITGLAAFILSIIWYSPLLFGSVWAHSEGGSLASTPIWKFFTAPLREIFSAFVFSFIIVRVKPKNWKDAFILGLVLWLGFYIVQLAGSVIWENMPWQIAAVHAGDWLMKTLFIILVLSALQRRAAH